MGWEQDLDRAYDEAMKRVAQTIRAVAIVVDQKLVETTPVDTGRARANWQVSLNEPLSSQVPWSDETRKESSFIPPRSETALKAAAGFKIDDTIFITNNLPYIRRLNDGYSKQAPAGFVESAIAVGKRIIKK
jgi:hypothetical protein